MDELSYVYDPVKRNRLLAVNDAKGVNNGTDMGSAAYTYDAIGNLTGDTGAQISNIDWNVYGKIKQISKAGGNISYGYDPAGNRVSKSAGGLTTYYIRDAQGNSLAVYDNAGNGKNWREMQLYGSSRLGMWRPDVNLATAAGASKWNNNGLKFFELSNHLGNVMAVINDNRNLAGGTYEPVVINANDYYAFGSQMIGRTFTETNALAYRYGFNGKENDNDVKGEGGQQDYGMRIYDPRVARFLSTDPITEKYPELTPYQFASNTPIQAVDLDGLEALFVHGTWSDRTTWNKEFVGNMLEATKWNKVQTNAFYANWSGANSSKARMKAAEGIYNWVLSDKNPLRDLKHVTLIGHSHGGNVNKMVKNRLQKEGWVVDIVNIETPQREDFQTDKSKNKGIYVNFYSNTDLIQYLGSSDHAVPEINEAEKGARKDARSGVNIELDTYTKFGSSDVKRSVVAPLVYILEGAANGLQWLFKTSAGHSVHNNKQTEKQIVEKTAEQFKDNKP